MVYAGLGSSRSACCRSSEPFYHRPGQGAVPIEVLIFKPTETLSDSTIFFRSGCRCREAGPRLLLILLEPLALLLPIYIKYSALGHPALDELEENLGTAARGTVDEAVERAAHLVRHGDRAQLLALLGSAAFVGWLLARHNLDSRSAIILCHSRQSYARPLSVSSISRVSRKNPQKAFGGSHLFGLWAWSFQVRAIYLQNQKEEFRRIKTLLASETGENHRMMRQRRAVARLDQIIGLSRKPANLSLGG
jgi:hypothetical protein